MDQSLSEFLHFKHIVIVAHHPEANGIIERRNREIMKHLRALVMEKYIVCKNKRRMEQCVTISSTYNELLN